MPLDKEKLLKEIPAGTTIEAPFFQQYIQPFGFLDKSPECHALWWYYVNARKTLSKYYDKMEVVLEGEKDPEFNLEQLFTSIAFQYCVIPEHMAKCWDLVDAQAAALRMPLMPFGSKYRHQTIITVN